MNRDIEMSKFVTWLAFSCTHHPHHDPKAIQWLVTHIKDFKPDVLVALGDLIDTQCLSKFAKSNLFALSGEYGAVNEFLGEINDASPQSRKIWMQGNHEERMFREDQKHLSELLDYRVHRRTPSARKWRHFDYRFSRADCYNIGQVTFGHGWNTTEAQIKKEAVVLGVPNGLYVHGHTHRPHAVRQVKLGAVDLPYWYINPGTLIGSKPDYMKKRDDHQWGQGIVVGNANPKRRWGNRCEWGASMILRKMSWWKNANRTCTSYSGLFTPQYGPS